MPWWSALRWRLTLWFMVVALVPMGLTLWLAYDLSKESAKATAEDRLAAVTRARVIGLERFASERIRGVDAVATTPGFVKSCVGFSSSFDAEGIRFDPAYNAILDRYRPFIERFAASYAAPELLLIDRDGRVVFALHDAALVGETLKDPSWRDSALDRSVRSVRNLLHAEITAPERASDGKPSLWAVGPLLEGPRLVGCLAMAISPGDLAAIVADRSGLGVSGETIAAAWLPDSQGEAFIATVDLRSDPTAAFRRRFDPTSALGQRLAAAVHGDEQRGEAVGLDGREVIASSSFSPSFEWAVSAEIETAEAYAALAHLREAAALTVIGVVVAAFALAFGVARRIAAPIRDAAQVARRIADGDLTGRVVPRGLGEPRLLLEAMKTTGERLSGLVGRIQRTSRDVVESGERVCAVADTEESVARELSSSISQVAAATNQMTATAKELAATVTSLDRRATAVAADAGAGRAALGSLGAMMGRLESGGSTVSDALGRISEQATHIDTMVTAIVRIANQTNLLAVNAAIEAEKAGAAGRGFQVVAREIDRLATQTAANVLEIERVVIGVQGAVAEGVAEIGSFATSLADGCGTSHEVSDQLDAVIRQVEELKASFAQVATAVSGQSEGVAQVHEAMSRLVDGARRTAAAAEEGKRAGTTLGSAASELAAEVERFTVGS
jgi:methyl-accepting chemotaxis protein WspA